MGAGQTGEEEVGAHPLRGIGVEEGGVTGLGLCWTFFSLWIQPLKARAHPIWEYSDRSDPTRESEVELPKSEVVSRVADVVVGDAASVFNNHPPPLSLAKLAKTSLGKIHSHPPLPEDKERKAAAMAEAAEKKK
ncbi:hypothetical protein BAE44_0019261 [Dichanthelium oligosanthes]|uniref:Uncharacterized protein n=1 Tax=Dichanthelium oligosanthes TaxID=888268 RepID=A0A1E5V3J0_9POAL|nr:hypothetical protein BAE44_0019261 [Dichanthelium oligosanthes]